MVFYTVYSFLCGFFNRYKWLIASIVVLAVTIPLVFINIRSPVLIVTEDSFNNLYGEYRVKKDTFRSSLALFRRIKMVSIANEAGDDIVPYAISEVSSKPHCVIFPLRYYRSARLYKEQNPFIPVVLLEGRNADERAAIDYTYKTDIDSDFYHAGVAASAIASDGRIVVFLEYSIEKQAKEAFLLGLGPEKSTNASFYTSFSHYSRIYDISCVVFAGIGMEFLEDNPDVPVISLSWLDPLLAPPNVVLIINDSPIAQTTQAVRLLSFGEKVGQIRSQIIVINGKNLDKKILRKIKKIG